VDEFFKVFIKFYDDKIKKILREASDEDFVVCPLIENCYQEMTRAIGIKQVEDTCTSCGRKVCRTDVDTKAKVICEECFIAMQYV